ncbi:MAG: hypothetical protein HYV09_28625 [Deltaproteobacteria bacterium]|nr:hypothetical protein [Deltaproteobacteria bacterium]
MTLLLGYDVGTSGTKAALIDDGGALLAESVAPHTLEHPHEGWAEQDPESWVSAARDATREVLRLSGVSAESVHALAFAGQMLTLVPMDGEGRPMREAIAWMDARAEEEARAIVRRMGGARVVRALAGAVPGGKDIVAKVAWLRAHEPEVFARTRALGDATSFLVARTTGRLSLDPTAAGATGLIDPETRTMSRALAFLARFPLDRLPPLLPSTRLAGALHREGARALGLCEGTAVAMGAADIPAMAVGTGATRAGEAHVYLGTSAWIAAASDRKRPVPRAGVALVPSAAPSGVLLVGESETAGACRDWATRTLGPVAAGAGDGGDLDALAASSPAGARGLLFCPWLFGERAPFPDARLRGGFVGLGLEHGRADLARAVLEGVALNLRLIVEAMALAPEAPLRAAGGGAQSDAWLQIVADVTGRAVERVAHPRTAGAIGAALVAGVATGVVRSLDDARAAVAVDRRFAPRATTRPVYDAAVRALADLHRPFSRAAIALRGGGAA